MSVTDICIYFMIGILGLAYPVSFQAITRLDEKYNSINITNLFIQSWQWIGFRRLLYLSLIALGATIVRNVYFKPVTAPGAITYDSLDLLLISVTALMIAAFIFYTTKAFVYYTPQKLASHFRLQRETEDLVYFSAMADLLYTGIRIHDTDLIETVYRYMSQQFRQYRELAGSEPVQYPYAFYEVNNKVIGLAGGSPAREVQFIGFSAASGRWLLGGTEYHAIDEQTYQWLWNNLRLIVEIRQDDYLFEFWKNSHQYSYTGLNRVTEHHDPENPLIIFNQEEVNQRELERDRFYEFHFALGGMLLHAERYALLRRIFNHTTSIPPRYELLPMTMSEIFNLFFRFWDAPGDFYIGYYGFPGLHGIDGEQQAQAWICRYMALLLIRQYHIQSRWYGYEPVEVPHPPLTQAERYKWIHQLRYLKIYVAEIQANDTLLKALNYKRIDAAWSQANGNKPVPDYLIDQAIAAAEAAYVGGEAAQEPDPHKVGFFLTRSANIVGHRIESYQNIQNENPITEDFNSGYINGESTLYDKSVFAENQPIAHLNYDTFLASQLSAKITRELTGMFRSKVQNSYLFKANRLFRAVDRLALDPELHILLNFGIDIGVVNHKLQEPQLTPEQYNGIPILTLQHSNQQLITTSLLALRRADLPRFEYLDIPVEDRERFALQHINPAIHLYGAVIDLNTNAEVRALFPNADPNLLDKSVLLKLSMQLEVRWPNNIKIVQLGLYSEFYRQGHVNDLAEVEEF